MRPRSLTVATLLLSLPVAAGCIVHISGDGMDWGSGHNYTSDHARVKGDGVYASEPRDVGPFTSLSVSGTLDVAVRIGAEHATGVEVHGDQNVLEYVRTETDGDKLRISSKRSIKSTNDLLVVVTVPDLREAAVSGASDLEIEGIDREVFKITAQGQSDVVARGRVGRLVVSASGQSDLHLYGLSAGDADISISGQSDVYTTVDGTLTAEVSGSSDIHFKGNAKVETFSVSGSGSIQRSSD